MSISKMSKPLPPIYFRLGTLTPIKNGGFLANVAVVHGYVLELTESDNFKKFNFVTNELTQELDFVVSKQTIIENVFVKEHIGCFTAKLAYDDIKEEMTIVSTNDTAMPEDYTYRLFQDSPLKFALQVNKVAP